MTLACELTITEIVEKVMWKPNDDDYHWQSLLVVEQSMMMTCRSKNGKINRRLYTLAIGNTTATRMRNDEEDELITADQLFFSGHKQQQCIHHHNISPPYLPMRFISRDRHRRKL